MRELEKHYNPKQVEEAIYKKWIEEQQFKANNESCKKPYTIVIPPPNITGVLHMGHALNNTLQDIIIRTKRMQGFEVLWVPGSDHASIATEAKIVEALAAEGITKDMLGREEFMKRAFLWKDTYGGIINDQLKKLGSSCDWSRERFTLDEGCSATVTEVFIRLHEKGLIYRGERLINWCPVCGTSISDAEVDHTETDGFFWHIRYKISGTNEYINLATTRPETMLGDTALAVNPQDERYRHLVGKTAILPILNKEIPIVADDYVEQDFGTGVVKITPAHDPNDYEVGIRHSLPMLKVLDNEAKMANTLERYNGLDRFEARALIVQELQQNGDLLKTEPHKHNVGHCYRCNTIIEPMLSFQWFVKMKPLAEPAIAAVEKGETVFVPQRFDKIYYHWLNNIKDWCISRQLWWGHRIPAYYCDSCGEVAISKDFISTCPKCSCAVRQDEDTLDTWFSSALWPFSTLGWPEQTADLKYFYPTNTLVTGYDIIFFWVARMIFSALEFTGRVPFDTVLINGIVRDDKGRKMSKSLGNGINPLELIEEYGADALRYSLVIGTSPGNDLRFSYEKINAAKNFANKLWNAARFVLMNVDETVQPVIPSSLQVADKWVLSELNSLAKEFCDNMERFELGLAAAKVEQFIWDVYCDWYIEIAKIRLNGDDKTQAQNAKQMLCFVLNEALKLLHPYMPFITEEIFRALPQNSGSIMKKEMLVYSEKLHFEKEHSEFAAVMELIKAVRAVRTEMAVHPTKKTRLIIETQLLDAFESSKFYLQKFAFAEVIELFTKYERDTKGSVSLVTSTCRAYIPLNELIDKEKEQARLQKELLLVQKEIELFEGKLANAGFVQKAPEKLLLETKEKLSNAKAKKQKLLQSINSL